jgi:hypothetical protein
MIFRVFICLLASAAAAAGFAQSPFEPPRTQADVIARLRDAGKAAVFEVNEDGHLTSLRVQRIYGPPPSLPGDLAWLSLCPELEKLSLEGSAGSGISDEQLKRHNDRLKRLSELPKLRHVSLYSFGVSDDGVKHLAAIGQLQSLYLSSDNLSGSGLRQLSMSHNLRTLFVSGKALTDEGLASLAELPRLEVLTVSGADLTDETLAVISKLPHLESLSLGVVSKVVVEDGRGVFRQIMKYTPEGLANLAAAAKLRRLNLWDAPVEDDRFVPTLSRMTQLESLNLRGQKISESGIRTLSAALPETHIESKFGEFGPRSRR